MVLHALGPSPRQDHPPPGNSPILFSSHAHLLQNSTTRCCPALSRHYNIAPHSSGTDLLHGSSDMPIKFNEVKQGEAIMFNNEIWIVFKKDLQTRGNLRSYYQVLLKNLERGNVYNQRFSPEDNVEQAMLVRDDYEFLYMDGGML